MDSSMAGKQFHFVVACEHDIFGVRKWWIEDSGAFLPDGTIYDPEAGYGDGWSFPQDALEHAVDSEAEQELLLRLGSLHARGAE